MPSHDNRASDDRVSAEGRPRSAQVTSDSRKFRLFRNALKTMVHPAGTTIFEEGEQGKSMFAIKRGRVAIMVDGVTVDTLAEDEVFGEMALLEQATRSASAVTLEETELVEIDEPQFYLFVRQNPHFALQLMQLLSERLRRADALYRRPPEH
jgi:CRP-like cAMP-binding protein